MSITDYKITPAALDTKGVIAEPDTLTGSASDNKRVFDRLSREVVAPSLNGVIDTLAGTDGAANVGAAVDGVAGDNVQAVLDGMLPAVRSAAAAAAASADEAAAYARQAAAHTDLPITRGTRGNNSLVAGDIVNNKATNRHAFAEGEDTWAAGQAAHAEGSGTKAWDFGAHAEGSGAKAMGLASHAEGSDTEARGWHSHAEGYDTLADSPFSHAEGRGTKAQGNAQHAFGRYNDTAAGCAEVVGNGTADDARSNARTLDWDGNEWLAGKLTMEGTPTADKDAATKKYVDDAAAAAYALAAVTGKFGGKPVHVKSFSISIPSGSTATELFESNPVDTILSVALIVTTPNSNVDTIMGGYGMVSATGKQVIAQAFKTAAGQGYGLVATNEATGAEATGTMIVHYTLASGE